MKVSSVKHRETVYDGYVLPPPDLIVEFANTIDIETGDDQLATVVAAAAWMRAHGWGTSSVGDAERRSLVDLRDDLRQCLVGHHDRIDDPEVFGRLAERITRADASIRLRSEGTQLVARRRGLDEVLVALGDAIGTALDSGTWHRYRICPADDCLEAFLDDSRSGNRRWCSMELCGNRAKVRAFRDRQT
jgi:predicted RNA-binding Zn ribbon-like protein